ncbi:bile acid:sodium symporter family protein [Neptuniibacter sp.]|uniref:bile acid:sodium symporter family protein n=1 Tax=Neptuniibacter sp. TaxID=1962643 RepID=UPI003B5B6807
MEGSSVTQVVLPLALFLIMLGVGMSLKIADFQFLLRQPKAVLIGVMAQLFVLPLLGSLIVMVFSLPAPLAVGIMVLTFAPGGATSNMITYLCRGDTALSVCLTGITGLITPFIMPFMTLLAISVLMGEKQAMAFPVGVTVIKLLVISVLPAILGILINRKWPDFCMRIQKAIRIVAATFLMLVVFAIVKSNWERLPDLVLLTGPAVICLVTMAMLAGYGIARKAGLSGEQGLTLSIEVGIQNAAIALLITGGILQNPEMSASALIYGVLMNIPAFALIAYRNWPQKSSEGSLA